ncbi:MAG: hypothetical protein IT198_00920 [Acidimicrobiia bacterium]|nr:hypothetical protein [Acidimicrobiia bacterium]
MRRVVIMFVSAWGMLAAATLLVPGSGAQEPYSGSVVETGISQTSATFRCPEGALPGGTSVAIIVDGAAVGSTTTAADGSCSFRITDLHCDTSYSVQVEWTDPARELSAPVRLTTDPCDTESLAFTGSQHLGRNIGVALGLLLVGGTAVGIGRHRRRSAARHLA